MPPAPLDVAALAGVTCFAAESSRLQSDPITAMSHCLFRCDGGAARIGAAHVVPGRWLFLPRGLRLPAVIGGCRGLACWFPPTEAPRIAADDLPGRLLDRVAERAFGGSLLLPLAGEGEARASAVLDRMAGEWRAQRLGVFAMLRALLQELLVGLAREPAIASLLAEAAAGEARIAAALRLIDERFHRRLTVAELAAVSGLSASHFHARFKAVVGCAPLAYLTRYRRLIAQQLLMATDLPIADIAAEAGFASPSRLYAAFRATHGIGPASLRRHLRNALERARTALDCDDADPHELARTCGLASVEQLTRLCELRYGHPPPTAARLSAPLRWPEDGGATPSSNQASTGC
ncbi:MAG: helix-turn-helix domain-containing protein [Planctomycetota bacterium]